MSLHGTTTPAPVRETTPLFLDLESAKRHEAEWQKLTKTAVDPNPFFGPDFLCPLAEHTGQTTVRLSVIRDADSGDWLMALPVAKTRPGLLLPALTAYATDYSPLGTPLTAPAADRQTAEALLDLIQANMGHKPLALPYLPLKARATHLLTAAQNWQHRWQDSTERAAHDNGPLGQKQRRKALKGKRKKEFSRLRRRLAEQGDLRFESYSGPAARTAFEDFLLLEESGWKGRNGTALKSRPETLAFARQMIDRQAATDGLRIDVMSLQDRPLAMLVLLQQGGSVFSWKIAYDEHYARFSPGAQLVLFSQEANLQDPDFHQADSLAIPGHPMIDPLWRGRLAYGTLLLARPPLASARLALQAHDIALDTHLRRTAKKLLRR